MYKIHSIFYSLQCEGSWSGTPMIFIRFAGCNLMCEWCDTEYEAVSSIIFDAVELVTGIKKLYPQCKRVCLTGGEPLLQYDESLMKVLYDEDYKVHVETNGTIKIQHWVNWLTVSPKSDKSWIQRYGNELKVIWKGEEKEELEHYFSDSDFDKYFLQPCYPWLMIPGYNQDKEKLKKLIDIIKGDLRWNLSLQIQRLIDVK